MVGARGEEGPERTQLFLRLEKHKFHPPTAAKKAKAKLHLSWYTKQKSLTKHTSHTVPYRLSARERKRKRERERERGTERERERERKKERENNRRVVLSQGKK